MRYLAVIGLTSMLACAATQRRDVCSWFVVTSQPTSRPVAMQIDSAENQRYSTLKRHEIIVGRINKAFIASRPELANHEWAGLYKYGNGTGCNVAVALAPKTGMTYQWYGCGGLYDINYGPVVDVQPKWIDIALALPLSDHYDAIGQRLHRVRWGDRHYLVPDSQLLSFCNSVNSGFEAYHRTSFLLRDSDRQKDVFGLPDVPDPYRKYLLPSPIEAKIIKLGPKQSAPNRVDEYDAVIDIGKNAGLHPSMLLHLKQELEFPWRFWRVSVVTVDAHTSRIEIWDFDKTIAHAPKVGDVLCSRNSFYDRLASNYRDDEPVFQKHRMESHSISGPAEYYD